MAMTSVLNSCHRSVVFRGVNRSRITSRGAHRRETSNLLGMYEVVVRASASLKVSFVDVVLCFLNPRNRKTNKAKVEVHIQSKMSSSGSKSKHVVEFGDVGCSGTRGTTKKALWNNMHEDPKLLMTDFESGRRRNA